MFTMFMDTAAGNAASGGISGLLSDVGSIFNAAVNMVTGNPVGAVIIGAGLVGTGIALFRRIRH